MQYENLRKGSVRKHIASVAYLCKYNKITKIHTYTVYLMNLRCLVSIYG